MEASGKSKVDKLRNIWEPPSKVSQKRSLSDGDPLFKSRALYQCHQKNFTSQGSGSFWQTTKNLSTRNTSVRNHVEKKATDNNNDIFPPILNKQSCGSAPSAQHKYKNFNSCPQPYVKEGCSKDPSNSGVTDKLQLETQEQMNRKKVECKRIVGEYLQERMEKDVKRIPQKQKAAVNSKSSVCQAQLQNPGDQPDLTREGVKESVEKFEKGISQETRASKSVPGSSDVSELKPQVQRDEESVYPQRYKAEWKITLLKSGKH